MRPGDRITIKKVGSLWGTSLGADDVYLGRITTGTTIAVAVPPAGHLRSPHLLVLLDDGRLGWLETYYARVMT